MSPDLQIQGAVATLNLRRPEVANKLTLSDLAVVRSHVEQINRTTSVRILKIVGEGRHFCSGFDIENIQQSQAKGTSFGEMVDAIEACRAITIARIQGAVYGGAVDLALACDFRLGSSQSHMQVPPAKLGLHFYPTGMQRMCTRLGIDAAKRVLLRAEHFAGLEMKELGVLTDYCEHEALDTTLMQLEMQLLKMAPLALHGMKRNLNRIANGLWDIEQMELDVQASVNSADLREGMQAWKEKRLPSFSGH
ncbi:enoyl-CoA hydratase/isomerase family protein [Comamonas sp. GB3 AK4-5]|uniref:enoyl-CoA hydratase/isomerase family protein n=1 Tax=Comamonas sp. GB3 AK4-5 TaxID=3231487 RepID=UPI00351EBC16